MGSIVSRTLSIGQEHELLQKLEAAGLNKEDADRIISSRGNKLAKAMVAFSRSEAITSKHIVDLDADPFVPTGWTVEEHRQGSQFEWNPAKVELYLSDKQRVGYFEGHRIRKELKDQPVFNANLLDYLLANSYLIPEDWKGKYVFFWGTIYRSVRGGLCVRSLYYWSGSDGAGTCYGEQWAWKYDFLANNWKGNFPAAVLASN